MCYTQCRVARDMADMGDTNMKEKYGFYFRWAVTVISIIVVGILFFFFLFRLDAVVGLFKKIFSILTPVTLGALIAYLLNPIVLTLKRLFLKFFHFCNVPVRPARFLSKAIAITLSIGMLLTMFGILLRLVIPEIYNSVIKLASDFRMYGTNIYTFIEEHLQNNPDLLIQVEEILNKLYENIMNWINNDLIVQIQNLMSGLALRMIGLTKVATNIVVGLIISVYLLVSKDRFIGQCKKLLYTIAKPEKANVTLYIFRHVDKIFGGFISGKLLDSLIIGILCFIGLSVLKMPYAVLISVIVGVTNVIPFFGPYIGAIPSALFVLIVSPKQCFIFIIFILVLQQLDGNVIGPKILGDSTGLTPFWVVVSILLGGGLFGFLGMLLGVPTFAVIYFLIKTFSEYRLKEHHLPTASLCYCRIEQIDPDTGRVTFLENEHSGKKEKKKASDSSALNSALDTAKRIRQKSSSPEDKN